ncbi:MAG: hypothetical protein M3O25_00050, partial [Actinomycetota bacterium]|nr:hypothetical protein [Actinomycetota bacterium]
HAMVQLFSSGKGRASAKKTKAKLLGKGVATIAGGKTGVVKVKLTKLGTRLAKKSGRRKLIVRVTTAEQDGIVQARRVADV